MTYSLASVLSIFRRLIAPPPSCFWLLVVDEFSVPVHSFVKPTVVGAFVLMFLRRPLCLRETTCIDFARRLCLSTYDSLRCIDIEEVDPYIIQEILLGFMRARRLLEGRKEGSVSCVREGSP